MSRTPASKHKRYRESNCSATKSPLWLCSTDCYNRIPEVSIGVDPYIRIIPFLNTCWFPIVPRRNGFSLFCKTSSIYLWRAYRKIPIKYASVPWPRISPLFRYQVPQSMHWFVLAKIDRTMYDKFSCYLKLLLLLRDMYLFQLNCNQRKILCL